MPASVFSRSTECHNQDKVSMGTIAARDCLRVLELTEQVAAALLITVRQGVWLRCAPDPERDAAGSRWRRCWTRWATTSRRWWKTAASSRELRLLLERIRAQRWSLYA